MKSIVAWIKAHVWESVAAVLGVGLAVSLAFNLTAEEPPATADPVATTTTSVPMPEATTTTTPVDEGSVPTTEAGEVEVPAGASAVVVDNHPDAQPQIGLAPADLVLETPVESGMTRFTAFFGAEPPDLIGPVRSLRPVSADLLAPFRPVVFSTGGQPFVTGAVTAAGTTIVTPEMSIAFQSLERPQPHHLFVSPSVELAAGGEFSAPWDTGEWQGGDPLSEITLPISGGVSWRFEDGAYVRYQDGEPHMVLPDVGVDGVPFTRDTLIVMVAHQKSAGYQDTTGFDVPTFDVIGGGDLYLLHNGEVIEGTWFRPGQGEGYTFSDTAGETVPVPEGAVYWAIVPEGEPVGLGG